MIYPVICSTSHASRLLKITASIVGFMVLCSIQVLAIPICPVSGFAPARIYSAANLSPYAVATGDFNGDGRNDIAAPNSDFSGGVFIFLNDGAGSFGAATYYPTGFNVVDISIADFNGDAKLDLAVNHEDALGGSNNILILQGDGAGGFTPLSSIQPEPAYTRVADFNLDG